MKIPMERVSHKSGGITAIIGILLILLILSGFGLAYSFYTGNKNIGSDSQIEKSDFFTASRFNLDSLPHDKQGEMIRYGYNLVTQTASIIGPGTSKIST